MLEWSEIFPPFGLVIRCGPLELRPLRHEDIPALTHLATLGIHNDGRPMPFNTDWSVAPAHELPLNSAKFYWRTWSDFTPEAWSMNIVVRRDAEIVGCQDVMASDFVVRRVASTGSWLGLAYQRQGIGTLMRQVICCFAFDELGAIEMRTDAFVDNVASQKVSAAVGYTEYDRIPADRGGQRAWQARFKLTPERLVRPPYPVEVEGAEALRSFLGL